MSSNENENDRTKATDVVESQKEQLSPEAPKRQCMDDRGICVGMFTPGHIPASNTMSERACDKQIGVIARDFIESCPCCCPCIMIGSGISMTACYLVNTICSCPRGPCQFGEEMYMLWHGGVGVCCHGVTLKLIECVTESMGMLTMASQCKCFPLCVEYSECCIRGIPSCCYGVACGFGECCCSCNYGDGACANDPLVKSLKINEGCDVCWACIRYNFCCCFYQPGIDINSFQYHGDNGGNSSNNSSSNAHFDGDGYVGGGGDGRVDCVGGDGGGSGDCGGGGGDCGGD